MMLVIAPKYDSVTEQTHSVAEFALDAMLGLGNAAEALFADNATEENISISLRGKVTVVAYFGHGDESGRLLTQFGLPWCEPCATGLSSKIVYAHACRGMRYLEANGELFGLTHAMGYRTDLVQPGVADESFWLIFRNVHSFVVISLSGNLPPEDTRAVFYDYCTVQIAELYSNRSYGLFEMLSIQQARDDFEIIVFSSSLD